MHIYYLIHLKPQIVPGNSILEFDKKITHVVFDPDERILYLRGDGNWSDPDIAAIPVENILYWERVEESEEN